MSFTRRAGFVACVPNKMYLICRTMMTIAPYFSNDTAFALLISGRAVVAVGYYANITLSHEVKSHWFLGKELALAFTIYISSCRLGSVLVFTTVGGEFGRTLCFSG